MIAVTGVGAVTALGVGVEALWSGLCAGRTGILGPSEFGGAWPVAVVPGGPYTTADLGTRAALQALGGAAGGDDLAIVFASTSAEMRTGEEAFRDDLIGAETRRPEELLWSQLCHVPVEHLRRTTGALGLGITVSTACTSGAVALGVGADLLLAGRAARVLVVGADALCRTTVFGFGSLGAASLAPCRPFDAERSGMTVGEGAGALLLEHRDHLQGRPVLAWLRSVGLAGDAHRMTAPDPNGRGAVAAIRKALGDLPGEQVAFVSAHATATRLNDAMEACALACTVPAARVTGIKGAIGHTMGAAGTIEAIVAIEALRRGTAPPTVGLKTPISGVAASSEAHALNGRWGLSVNFAFGGHNAAVLFEKGEA